MFVSFLLIAAAMTHPVRAENPTATDHPARGVLKWAIKLGGIGLSSPGVAPDGTIYVGSQPRNPAVDPDGSLHAGRDELSLYAIGHSGKQKWTLQTQTGSASQPVIASDGTVYIVEGGYGVDFGEYGSARNFFGSLDAINPEGRLRWKLAGGYEESIYALAIGPDGIAYVMSSEHLCAYRPDGHKLWSGLSRRNLELLGEDLVSINPVANSRLELYAFQRALFARRHRGKTRTVHLAFDASPGQVDAECLAVGNDGTIFVSGHGRLFAFMPNGQKKWAFAGGEAWNSIHPTVDSRGIVYATCGTWGLLAVDTAGKEKWRFRTGGRLTDPVIGPDGTVFVGSSDHNVYAISRNGPKKWQFRTGGSISAAPAVGLDGTVYVASRDGMLYAIR